MQHRFAVVFFGVAAILSLVSRAGAWQSAGSFKPRIVFVRADPSRGVQSNQFVTAFDQNSGQAMGGHAAPSLAMPLQVPV